MLNSQHWKNTDDCWLQRLFIKLKVILAGVIFSCCTIFGNSMYLPCLSLKQTSIISFIASAVYLYCIKLFKNGSREICERQPYHFKYFKRCLPQILLGSFLNILTRTQGWEVKSWNWEGSPSEVATRGVCNQRCS